MRSLNDFKFYVKQKNLKCMKEKINSNYSILKLKMQERKKLWQIAFIAFIIMIPFTANSQMYYYFPENNVVHYNYDYSDFDIMSVRYLSPFNQFKPFREHGNQYKENKIKSLKVIHQDIKKDKTPYLSFEKNFNENGYVVSDKSYNRKGKNVYHIEREYNESIMTMFKSFKRNGKINSWYETKTDSIGNVIESNTLDEDSNIYLKRAFRYNENRKILENCTYKGKKQKLFYRIVYSYYSNSELESAATYKGNGKLQKFWSYACSSKGQETKNMKDTVKVCKISDYDKDGGFTITNISTGYDGQLSKTIRKFDKDSVLIDYTQYDRKNKFVSKRITEKVYNGWLCQDTYYNIKKQTPRIVRIYEFNNSKKIVKSTLIAYNRKGKIKYKTVYEYNDNEYNSKIIYYNNESNSIYKSKDYIRNENGMSVLITEKDKFNKITSKTIFQYL